MARWIDANFFSGGFVEQNLGRHIKRIKVTVDFYQRDWRWEIVESRETDVDSVSHSWAMAYWKVVLMIEPEGVSVRPGDNAPGMSPIRTVERGMNRKSLLSHLLADLFLWLWRWAGRIAIVLGWIKELNSFSLDDWNGKVNIELVALSFTSGDSCGRKSILLQAKCVEEKPSVHFGVDLLGTFDKLHTLT